MEKETGEEIIGLLTEIRDLLIPMSDEFRGAYEERRRIVQVLERVVNTSQRRKMYISMNGKRTQTDIAQEAGVTQGSVSIFISALVDKGLVDMVPVGATKRPVRKYDLDTGRKLGGEDR